MKNTIIPLLKASRADFLGASLIPFSIGAAHAHRSGADMHHMKILLGAAGVASLHLCANLINDFYDYKSGVDNLNEKVSSFFGGSRAIQRGCFSARQILVFAGTLLLVSFLCGFGIFLISGNPAFLLIMPAVSFLAVEYTAPPLRFSYVMLGEAVIFLLFGILLVMGGFYLFSETLGFSVFLISLPISFLILAVILCNEIPDYSADSAAGKKNLISLIGPSRGHILLFFSFVCSAGTLLLNVILGNLPSSSVYLLLLYFPAIPAVYEAKNRADGIKSLVRASGFTVIQHLIIGVGIITVLLL